MTSYQQIKPLTYEVGRDVSTTHWEQILVGVTDWFRELYPKETEPASRARQRLNECLLGITVKGEPWYSMDRADLASRIRVKCQYDIDRMEGLRKILNKKKQKAEKEEQARRVRQKAGSRNKFLPETMKEELRREAVYGDDPKLFMTTKEHALWQDYFNSYVEQFPELSTVNAQAELQSLCDAHILKARYRMQVLAGEKVKSETIAAVDKQLVDMKKALGIHPDQLIKRIKPKTELSVAMAAKKLQELPNWVEIRQRIWDEQLIQFYQMYMMPRADGEGYQLDEVRLYGLTKSKVVKCPHCGHDNFSGLPIEVIEEHLLRSGRLEEAKAKAILAEQRGRDGINDKGSTEANREPEAPAETDGGTEGGVGISDSTNGDISGIS